MQLEEKSFLPRVTILMATYNGARFLEGQLQSFIDQKHSNWALWASDDGSTDDTRSILEDFQETHPDRDITIIAGPQQGFVENFMSLLCHPDRPDGYIAFSDQDDVWLNHKLTRALYKLSMADEQQAGAKPRMYGSRTCLVDSELSVFGLSKRMVRPPSFRNALLQNIAGGNTLLFNPEASEMLRKAGPQQTVCHDWWSYLLITGSGGELIFDDKAGLLYRQHDNNMIGANRNTEAKLKRLRMLLSGQLGNWCKTNLKALKKATPLLTAESAMIVEDLSPAIRKQGIAATKKFFSLGCYRQSRAETFLVYLTLMLGRF